jgi:hypothetical protein
VAGENALPCYDREGYMSMVEMAKPRNDPDRRHFSFFVYQQPIPLGQGTICFPELDYFIKSMHGKVSYSSIVFVWKYIVGFFWTNHEISCSTICFVSLFFVLNLELQ